VKGCQGGDMTMGTLEHQSGLTQRVTQEWRLDRDKEVCCSQGSTCEKGPPITTEMDAELSEGEKKKLKIKAREKKR